MAARSAAPREQHRSRFDGSFELHLGERTAVWTLLRHLKRNSTVRHADNDVANRAPLRRSWDHSSGGAALMKAIWLLAPVAGWSILDCKLCRA